MDLIPEAYECPYSFNVPRKKFCGQYLHSIFDSNIPDRTLIQIFCHQTLPLFLLMKREEIKYVAVRGMTVFLSSLSDLLLLYNLCTK